VIGKYFCGDETGLVHGRKYAFIKQRVGKLDVHEREVKSQKSKVKSQKAKVKRQKAKGKRQKAKGKRQKAKGNDCYGVWHSCIADIKDFDF